AYPLELLSPSDLRIEAPCKHFQSCGGCKWQNLDYPDQLKIKKDLVLESLQHIGDVQPSVIHDVLPSPLIFGYRNKMEFSFSDNRWLTPQELKNPEIKKGEFALGLHVPRFFDKIVDIEKCWLQTDLMNDVLQFSKSYFKQSGIPVHHNRKHTGVLRYLVLRQSFADEQLMVNIVTFEPIAEKLEAYARKLVELYPQVVSVLNNVNSSHGQHAIGQKEFVVHGQPTIREKISGFVFEISANSFFQTNSLQAENLYKVVAEFAGTDNDLVWDLYSGTGSIAIFLSRNARKISGFELIRSSIEDSRRNAEINGVDNCEFIAGDLRFTLKEYASGKPDLIICDPPRAGMHEVILRQLLELSSPKIIYVSCNPATMARDLSVLKGKYSVEEIQPVDMFPHTNHIESVARLELR
ncbi:MAG: 23S rRNA (uracil(1939)-C(5))-methyltransferase RlmD, partial [Calditrichia bacterium]